MHSQGVEELKQKIEAILFAAGKTVPYEELARLARTSAEQLKAVLAELKSDYEAKGSALLLTADAIGAKLTVRERFLPIVHKLMPETELPKSVLETLAVITWKQPVLQSQIVKIRTNKAYDHIKLLEELGFVSKEKFGRSFMLRTTPRFAEYFELPSAEAAKAALQPASALADPPEIHDKTKPKGEEEKKPKEYIDKLEVYEAEARPEEEKEIEKAAPEEVKLEKAKPEKAEEKEKVEEKPAEAKPEDIGKVKAILEKLEEEKKEKPKPEEKPKERELIAELEAVLEEEEKEKKK